LNDGKQFRGFRSVFGDLAALVTKQLYLGLCNSRDGQARYGDAAVYVTAFNYGTLLPTRW
jgi:hypothetical protein